MTPIQHASNAHGSPEDLFLTNLPMIDALVQIVARRHRLSGPDAEEFGSIVRLRLIEHDYAILRKFKGTSSLRTFLTIVIARQCLDYRVACWGRWRPSSKARRLGPTAVRLEKLLIRDGLTLNEACVTVETGTPDVTRDELHRLADQLPRRVKSQRVDVSNLEDVCAAPTSSAPACETDERRAILAALARALRTLDPADRRLLKLRFTNGLTVMEIARREGLEQNFLYRRVDRLLRSLRRELEGSGIHAGSALDAGLDAVVRQVR